MKRSIVAASAVLTFVLAACSGGSGYKTESVDVFAKTIADPAVVVIDVRTPEEFATGHIANAVNMNVESPEFDTQVSNVAKSASVAVYCHSGRRSAIAADKMMKAGFTNIHNLDGGISAWIAAGQLVTS